jgi:glycosyltransferase involved in cell wall biosynthesis
VKILQIHNEYINSGGEEVVVANEKAMLVERGHRVQQWILKNSSLQTMSPIRKAGLALQSIWSYQSYVVAKEKITEFSPDIVHVHNTVPQISSSVYAACQELKVPVVQTLHNYKFICPGSNFYRDGKICEDCLAKPLPYPALIHGCYRNKKDYLSTAFHVSGLVFNRVRRTYDQEIDQYIALSDFARNKFIEGGLPADKISVKPNFINSNIEVGSHSGNYALYAGRLIPQKGIHTLLKAWSLLKEPIPLKIAGHGPLESLISQNLPGNVEYLGPLPRNHLLEVMKNATLLIFPTEWYEVFGLVLIEAFATGMPVIASRIGGVPEIVKESDAGWLFTPGDPHDLAQTVHSAWLDQNEIKRRGHLARTQFEKHYTQQKNYEALIEIYQRAISACKSSST